MSDTKLDAIEQKVITRAIADRYGFENQSNLLIEEMAELTQAINKYKRTNDGQPTSKPLPLRDARANIVEEIADVIIMLRQVQWLLGIEDFEIEIEVEKKLKRTFDLM